MIKRRTFIHHSLGVGLGLATSLRVWAEDKPADQPSETATDKPTDQPSATTDDKPADQSTMATPPSDAANTATPAAETPAPTPPAVDPFAATTLEDALKALGAPGDLLSAKTDSKTDIKPEKTSSKDKKKTKAPSITLKAPEIAESGAIVPVIISATLSGVKDIHLLVKDNPRPLIASFNLMEGTEPFISTRIRMDKSSDVIALLKTDEKFWHTKQSVKVVVSGCDS